MVREVRFSWDDTQGLNPHQWLAPDDDEEVADPLQPDPAVVRIRRTAQTNDSRRHLAGADWLSPPPKPREVAQESATTSKAGAELVHA